MNSLYNHLVVILFKGVARLPFWILYRMADLFFLFNYYIIQYRRKVIITNLKNSFPEKSIKEINSISKKFLRHLSDVFFESIKLHRMTDKQLNKRIKVNNLDMIDAYYEKKMSVILLGMHYNNWEWSASLQRLTKIQLLMIYNPVRKNKEIERFILDTREQFGGLSVPVNLSARTAIQFSNEKKPCILWLAADQTPPPNSHFWTIFLNQETPFFSGPERIAIKTNQPIVFHHTRKIARGKYEVDLNLLVEKPAEMSAGDIMLKYIHKMEEIIRKEPEYWLWSHRRWKHIRPEEIELYMEK